MDEITKRKIMIIAKASVELTLLENTLQKDYFLVRTHGLTEAFQQAQSVTPDLIILDHSVMETEGNEVGRRLREVEELKEIPIILLSELQDEESLERVLTWGISDCICKPINMFLLLRRVENYIELRLLREIQFNNRMSDNLTQLASRQRFIELLIQEWERAKRNGSVLSVLILDIDSFKRYNDTYGHGQGDSCLFTIAQTLKSVLKRPCDLVARWGSEEFACILPETDLRGVLLIGDNVRKAIKELRIPYEPSKEETSVTVSLGASSIRPAINDTYEDFLRMAEKALDMAKDAGGDRLEAEIA